MTGMTTASGKTSGRGLRAALVAIVAALPLAACQQGPMTTSSSALTVAERHPIGAVPERVVLDIAAPGGAMSPADAAELETFVLAYGQEGSGPLYVLAPKIGGASGAEVIYAETRRIAHSSGIPVAAVSYAAYDPVGGPAPVRLLYERLVAATVCGQWPTNAAADMRNEPYFNYGCATQKNFAAMLEDPGDLDGPRPSTPRDASRRDLVIEKYRKGEVTGSQDPNGDGGRISDVGN